ncbi:MAG: proprotein convertase P-domain-containing protein [Polyangiaceae bacterium]
MRTRFGTWLAFPGAVLALSGCQLITSIDENEITSASSGSSFATTSTVGGAGGAGGATASSSGQGGAGGAACVNPVTDCPPSPTACVTPICDGTTCSTENAVKDTDCTDAGGRVCDGAGKCVACTDALLHCADPMNECLLPSCLLGACGTTPVDDLTPTSAPTQIAGDCKLQVCDGMGGTKPINDDDPLDDGKACTIDTCTNGVNTPQPEMAGKTCADDGGKVCGSGTKAGLCVECLQDSDCTGGLVCDEASDNFKCVSPTCFDLTLDGSETDVDCGGASCSACANGKTCGVASDCTSAFCNAGTCAACTTDGNCLASEFCNTATGVCTPDKVGGATCSGASQCQSASCVDSVCRCVTPRTLGLRGVLGGREGAGPRRRVRACREQLRSDNGCAVTATSLRHHRRVQRRWARALYSSTTVCNVSPCTNGVQSNTDLCDGAGTCSDAGTVNCAPYTCDAAGLACLTTCATDNECIAGDFCDATSHCVPKNANGTMCGGANACTSGNCIDGVCCNASCGADCFACNVAGSVGVCSPVASGQTDGACTGTNSCNGSGTCQKNDGQACALGSECVSGNCADGVCCNTSCTGSCQACSAVKKGAGANGTCGFIVLGSDPDAECAGAFTCDGAGVCESCSDTVQNGNETDTDCGGSCGGCANGDACVVNGDCLSNLCAGNVCTPTGCSNGVKDGSETDIDCGGGICPACAPPKACLIGADCTENVCTGNVCQNASCTDLVKNGTETDADCGGTCPIDCATGQGCSSGADCQTGVCLGNVCQAATCFDSVTNGAETDTDCGGPTCADCVPGKACLSGNDCTTGVCTGNICQMASCSDGVKNGAETATDCGGSCSGCADGLGCVVAGDCQSGVCTGNICQAPACGDSVLHAGELCDDGNTTDNDGCSARCKIEVPYTCAGAGPNSCTSTKEINCNDGKDSDGDALIDCADPDCSLACNANFGGPCGAGETLLAYTSTDVPKSIPDNNVTGINSILTVGGLGLVKRAVLQFNVTHTFDGDLSEKLTSPAGIATDATSNNGSSGQNYTNTILNTSCATSVTAGTAPFAGCFKPEAPFTAYTNSPAKGVWTLNSSDNASTDTGTLNSWTLALCVSPTTCGDGNTTAPETCDDANAVSGDGCDVNCTITGCGNGVLTAGETCDDGNLTSGDGCDSNCKPTGCGNGVTTAGETCDDGNLTNGDGCDSNCKPTGCGNGVVTAGETCDDGNLTNGDGCDANCTRRAAATVCRPQARRATTATSRTATGAT